MGEEQPSIASARALSLLRRLREDLLTRAAGERFDTEKEIAERHGVSRTMVREAVSALRSEGLLETRRGSGSFVAVPNRDAPFRLVRPLSDVGAHRELYELRAPIERAAAALAAARRRLTHLRTLERAVADMTDGALRVEADFVFHLTVASATGNPLFERFVGHVDGRLFAFLAEAVANTMAYHADQVADVVAEHTRVLRAIEASDAEAADQAMRDHLAASASRMALLLVEA